MQHTPVEFHDTPDIFAIPEAVPAGKVSLILVLQDQTLRRQALVDREEFIAHAEVILNPLRTSYALKVSVGRKLRERCIQEMEAFGQESDEHAFWSLSNVFFILNWLQEGQIGDKTFSYFAMSYSIFQKRIATRFDDKPEDIAQFIHETVVDMNALGQNPIAHKRLQ